MATAAQTVDTSQASNSSKTVYIGCKLPNGIILEIVKPGPTNFPLPPGVRVTLKGANSLRRDIVKDVSAQHFGYAITAVDKAWWDAWLAHEGNSQLTFIKNGQVFVADSPKQAAGKAAEMTKDSRTRTKMEPLHPDKDARNPRDEKNDSIIERSDQMKPVEIPE